MPLFSLITSLYRPLVHLSAYTQSVVQAADALSAHPDITLEMVLVHNDPTPPERAALTDTITTLSAAGVRVQRLETPRETLYASWNRGFAAASGTYLGSWNVDDRRTADGLRAANEKFAAGAALVDMACDIIAPRQQTRQPAPYDPQRSTPKTALGPFFLMHRDLFTRAGEFNPNFRIAGDFEWATRAVVRASKYQAVAVSGGAFYRHADTLSGSHNPREWIEFNTALIWRGQYSQLRPADPTAMRAVWHEWGYSGTDLPDEAAAWLWGKTAPARYQRYQQEQSHTAWQQRLQQAGARRGWWSSLQYELAYAHPLRHLDHESHS